MNVLINQRVADCFSVIIEQLSAESDRGSVILAAAWADELVTELLAAFLCDPLNGKEQLLKVGGPIGDLGAKIDLAYRLGLMRVSAHRSLNLLRRLRNDFAHLSAPLTFKTPSVEDRVGEMLRLNEALLSAVWENVRRLPAAKEALGELGESDAAIDALLHSTGTRFVFDLTASMTACGLVFAIADVEKLQVLE